MRGKSHSLIVARGVVVTLDVEADAVLSYAGGGGVPGVSLVVRVEVLGGELLKGGPRNGVALAALAAALHVLSELGAAADVGGRAASSGGVPGVDGDVVVGGARVDGGPV